MAEPSQADFREIARYFLPAFNLVNNSDYSWTENRLRDEPSDKEFLNSNKEVMEIQYVEATGTVEDVIRQKIRPEISGRVIQLLREELNKRGVERVRVDINIHNPPSDRKLQQQLVFKLAYIIGTANLKDSMGETLVELDLQEYEELLALVREWVSTITVYRQEKLQPSFSFSSWEYPISASSTLDAIQRFENAVSMKINKYEKSAVRNINLVVDFVDFPWSDYEVEEIKTRASALNPTFKSIWIIQRWLPESAIEVFRQDG